MKTKSAFITLPAIALSLLVFLMSCEPKPDTSQSNDIGNRKSPIAIASAKYNGTYIKVVYGQPYRRGRTIFGGLEPYGEVWRTGANEATEITITEAILMGEEVIYPGTYALFTIPKPESWTIILNNALGQWGAFNYSSKRDYKRLEFPVKNLESPVEAFSIQFSEPTNSTSTMTLKWDVVQVDIPIRFY